jgi:programmed cell death protein 5
MKQQKEQQENQQEQQRRILKQALEPEAFERLSRVGMVKPERKAQVTQLVFQQLQSGQVTGKISEDELVRMMVRLELSYEKCKECSEDELVRMMVRFELSYQSI